MDMELADVKIEPSSWEPTDHVDTDIQVDEMDLKPFYADDLKVEQNEESQTEQATAGSSETSRGTSGSLECLPGTSTDTSRATAELPREISDDPAVEEHAAVQDNGKKTNLIAQSLEGFAIIANHYSLFEDYKTMARSGKSVLCCQPAARPALVNCMVCGEDFSGNADRLLKLCNHFQTVHPPQAFDLILDAIDRYDGTITRMRKALKHDKIFCALNYKDM